MSPDERAPWEGWAAGDGPGDRMIEDRIRAVFEEPIVPLGPPPGTWERIRTDAARRRRARRLLTVGSAAAAVALLAGGVVWLGAPGGDGGPPPPTPAPPATAATTPAPSPTERPTGEPEPSEATATATSGAVLPGGGPVPRGFVAVSVTTAGGPGKGVLYALGTAPCRAEPCTSLVRSQDGGVTWAGVPAPTAELSPALTRAPGGEGATADTVADVRFATPLDGWAFGGALWQTHDGAVTWEQVPGVRGRVLDLATDGTEVWAVTSTCAEGPCADGVEVLHGRAGARRLTRTTVLHPDSLDAHLVGGGGAMWLAIGGPQSQLYLARPGGTLAKAATPCPPPGVTYEGELLAVAPPAQGDGGLVGFCGEPAAGTLHVVTVRSTDGGRTWSRRGDVAVPNGAFSAMAVTADVVLLAGGNPDLGGALRVSRDGGRGYRTPDVDAPPAGWRWVGAAGGGRVLALPLVATGAVYVSTDSGASFVARPIR